MRPERVGTSVSGSRGSVLGSKAFCLLPKPRPRVTTKATAITASTARPTVTMPTTLKARLERFERPRLVDLDEEGAERLAVRARPEPRPA